MSAPNQYQKRKSYPSLYPTVFDGTLTSSPRWSREPCPTTNDDRRITCSTKNHECSRNLSPARVSDLAYNQQPYSRFATTEPLRRRRPAWERDYTTLTKDRLSYHLMSRDKQTKTMRRQGPGRKVRIRSCRRRSKRTASCSLIHMRYSPCIVPLC